jgi:hypothetical protein
MMHQWLESFGPIKGDIECTSLVFRVANRLGLTNNCIISHISEPRSMMDLDFFRQAQILKKTNNTIFMRYHSMITKIPLPNSGLRIYAVRDYLVGLQPLPLNRRSTSARLENVPPMHYYGADPTPEGPGYTAYTDQPGTSRQHHPWAPSPSYHSSGSSQVDSEEGHRRSRSRDSQPKRSVDRPEPSQRHQEPPRHSVSGVEGQLAHLNLRMDTISEEQVNINQRLADQQQWNAQFGVAMDNIQQNQAKMDETGTPSSLSLSFTHTGRRRSNTVWEKVPKVSSLTTFMTPTTTSLGEEPPSSL